MRLLSTIVNDVRIQYRSGFYFAYLFVTLFYIAIINQFPESFRMEATLFVVMTDPSVLGFYFVGGIILLERRQNTYAALFITPLTVCEYLISKIISLGILSLISTLIIVFASRGFTANYLLLTSAVITSSVLFTLIGTTLGVRAKDINTYLFISPLYLMIFLIPVMRFFVSIDQRIFSLLPTNALFNLLHASFSGKNPSSPLIDSISIAVWITITALWAYRWFHTYVIEKHGTKQ